MKEASAYALAYVDADRNKAYEDAYATLQERGLRTAGSSPITCASPVRNC